MQLINNLKKIWAYKAKKKNNIRNLQRKIFVFLVLRPEDANLLNAEKGAVCYPLEKSFLSFLALRPHIGK